MTTDYLKFSPDILRRLGEELVPQPEQGIVELVRNSYDADAVSCTVEINDAGGPGGAVCVTDDGVGMDVEAISSGWLVVGRSPKVGRQVTGRGRYPVGDKGLGRLAALRMGRFADLATRPKRDPGKQFRLVIDWVRVDSATVVEGVPFEIKEQETREPPGTTIEIRDLHVALGRREVNRLARSLLLLADPFDDSTGFHPQLVAPAFSDLEKRVRESYFAEADHKLVASLDEAGRGQAEVVDWKNEVLWKAAHEDLSDRPYEAPAATFELSVFLLDSKTFSSRSVSLREVRQWLQVVGGVHLYHRGLRAHPYGDPGHDWLEMNLRRARSPEERPSTNTSIGRVVVPDPGEHLIQKTDRTGFIENEAFGELRGFCTDALDWMAKARLRARERGRQKERVGASRSVVRARESVKHAMDEVPVPVRRSVEKAVERLDRARDRESRALREELQLYRTLATVGTTAAVFAHESAKPVSQIERTARIIENRGRRLLKERYAEELEKPVGLVIRSSQALRSFAALPLSLLKREKRRVGRVDVHAVIGDVHDLFEPFLTDARIRVDLELTQQIPSIRGSAAALEAIVANLLTNAVNAFAAQSGKVASRRVVIRTELSGDRLLLRVMDNGPGITDISVDDIWLPGQSTVPGGTGLGLTIVRDSAVDLGGSAHALAHGELEGAELVVELPTIGA